MKSKILIIDDEENIRFGFEMILADQGYDVMTAIDYDSALKIISDKEPDLIISDIILGGHTGIDLLHEIKTRKLHCPVIMITGEPNIETSTDAVRLGAFDYIPKPIRKETLLRITSHGLQHKKLLDTKIELEADNLRVRHNMEAIFRSLKDGVVTVDEAFQVIEANEAVKDICRFPVKDITGKNFEEIQTGCSKSCINVLKETLKTKKTINEFRIECRHPEKPRQIVLLTGSPLRHNGIKSLGAVLVVRDITRLTNLERDLKERHHFHRIIGKSHRMQKIYAILENLSDTDSTVLITGETGTGKELVAHAIHHNSTRKGKPFVKVNCSALSENLLESELFGHVKGAFTGAVKNREGRFQMADQGTIFLDEIGDVSPLIQLKLLRVIQEKEIERVGDSTPMKIDVRVIAATNCNLKEKIKTGAFREDLYYRIKVVDIPVPSLSERREDIPLLINHFLGIFNTRFKKQINGLSNEVVTAFMNYPWPGNIRELEHTMEHGFVLCQGQTMLFDHLPVEIKEYSGTQKPVRSGKKSVNKDDILNALEKAYWNKSQAARLLGIGRRTIYRKIKEYRIVNPMK
ncbi:sigma-54 dependent transcriptional regulator [Desulfobacter postgatei]|uniref:sigma-54 dependent transcriptional regulator n=1 Tax=Desulfobacter postgatei TaxID=2293 RepID=UPI00259B2CF0|nr:sigma-54 dependent transcriptional regulator [uncultured Desulfobacter sp.]